MSTLPSQQEAPPLVVEIAFGADVDDPGSWTWTDVSGRLLSQSVTIRRGGSDWGSRSEPTTASFQLENNDGALTPDNPLSTYWPNVARNTPCRVSVDVPGQIPFLSLPGLDSSQARTPDDTSLHITGDISVRFDGSGDWTRDQVLAARLGADVDLDDEAWFFIVFLSGYLAFTWSPDGTDANRVFMQSTEKVPLSPGRLATRVDLDVNNAGNHTATFYTASTIAGSWTQLGDPVTAAGTTSIFASTADLEVGSAEANPGFAFAGEVYGFELYDAVTRVAAPDFTAQPVDTISFTDAEGLTWSILGQAKITSRTVRFVGQIDAIAPTWPYGDISDGDHPGEARVDITASGVLRRLSQGAKPLDSTLFRAATSNSLGDALIAYWPCEDGADATSFASPVPGVAPLAFTGATPASNDTLPASKPLPSVSAGQGAGWSGVVPPRTVSDWLVDVFVIVPTPATSPAETLLAQIVTTGTVRRWTFTVNNTALTLHGFDATDTEVVNSGAVPTQFFDGATQVSLRVLQEGANIRWQVAWLTIGGAVFGFEATLAGTLGRVVKVESLFVAPADGLTFGHIAVTTGVGAGWLGWSGGANNAYIGETAGNRIRRLCAEEGVPLVVIGNPANTEPMGAQRPRTLLELLTEAAEADVGILCDDRDRLGLAYRTGPSLYNQTPALTLDAGTSDITHPFEPVLDDQGLRNDVTVTRPGGSSARKTTDPPPQPGDVYDESVEVNVAFDGQLGRQAGWRFHLGTWPGMRYPSVSSELTVAPHQIASWLALEPGDRVQVDNLPPQHPAESVDVLVQGWSEVLSPQRWTPQMNCTPAGPFDVSVEGVARADTSGSVLNAAVNSTATTWQIAATHRGARWRSAAGGAAFPFDITASGEDVTVSDIDDIPFTFGAVGSATHANNAAVTPGAPAGVVAGNLLVIFAAIRNFGAGTVNVPAGWVRWPLFDATENVALLARIAQSNGEAMPSVTFSGGVANADTSAQCARFTGTFRDAANLPIRWGAAGLLSSTNIPYPATRVPYDQSLVLYVGWRSDDWTSVATIGGATEIGEPSTTTGDDQGIVWDYLIQTTATDIASGEFSVTGGAAGVVVGGVIVLTPDVQTFTVARAANGVTKSQTAETSITLADRPVAAL